MQTEFEFHLPRGFCDATGQVHRDGIIRLATALDEIEAVQDPRVQENDMYLPVALLSRVIVHLGSLPKVTAQVISGLFASDLAYLEDLYLRMNSLENVTINTVCPLCSGSFQIQVAPLGQPEGFQPS